MESQSITPLNSGGNSPIETPPKSPEIIIKDGITITIIPLQLTNKDIPNSVGKK